MAPLASSVFSLSVLSLFPVSPSVLPLSAPDVLPAPVFPEGRLEAEGVTALPLPEEEVPFPEAELSVFWLEVPKSCAAPVLWDPVLLPEA